MEFIGILIGISLGTGIYCLGYARGIRYIVLKSRAEHEARMAALERDRAANVLASNNSIQRL
jgi:hypothetical protein